MTITFRQIDAFRTVMQAGTVTEAARMLDVSQPAVSRLILDLEDQVGFKLFRRAGRSLVPTVEARLLVDEVRRAIAGLERIKEAAEAIRTFRHARFGIITGPTFSTMIVPGLMGRFAQRCPEAAITLEVQAFDDAVEWMVTQDFEFGIIPGNIETPLLRSLPLLDRAAMCIVPEGHPLAARDILHPQDMEGQSFVSYRSGSRFRFMVDEVFKEAGVERRLQYEARTTDSICRLVAEGLGIAIIGTIEAPLHSLRGCALVSFAPELPFSAKLIWSDQRPLPAVAQEFLAMITEEGV